MNRRVLEVALAVVIGAVIVAVWFTVTADDGANEPTPGVGEASEPAASQPATSQPATGTRLSDGDVEAFLDVWVASQELDVVVVGREQTLSVDPTNGVDPIEAIGEITGSIDVRRATLGDRRIEQVGTNALVTGPEGQRSCDLLDGQFLCTDPVPAPSIEEQLVEFTDRLSGESPTYDLFDDGDGCWRAVAAEPSPILRWGQISVWCFDAATGALAQTAQWRGEDRVRRFEATEIRTDVVARDLDPQ